MAQLPIADRAELRMIEYVFWYFHPSIPASIFQLLSYSSKVTLWKIIKSGLQLKSEAVGGTGALHKIGGITRKENYVDVLKRYLKT